MAASEEYFLGVAGEGGGRDAAAGEGRRSGEEEGGGRRRERREEWGRRRMEGKTVFSLFKYIKVRSLGTLH